MPREFDDLESSVLPPSLNAPFRDFSNYYATLGPSGAAPGMVHPGVDPRKEKVGALARGVKDLLVYGATAPFDITNRAIRGGYGDNQKLAEDVFRGIVLGRVAKGRQFGGPVGTLADIPNVRIERLFRQLKKPYEPGEYQDDEADLNPAYIMPGPALHPFVGDNGISRRPLGPHMADQLDLATPEQRAEWGPVSQVLDFAPAKRTLSVPPNPAPEVRKQILERLGHRQFGGPVGSDRPPLPPGFSYADEWPGASERPQLPEGFYYADEAPQATAEGR